MHSFLMSPPFEFPTHDRFITHAHQLKHHLGALVLQVPRTQRPQRTQPRTRACAGVALLSAVELRKMPLGLALVQPVLSLTRALAGHVVVLPLQ